MKICEMFRSIQGEGITIGSVTFFIRTAGCNLTCSWCDTVYARSGGEEMFVRDILKHAKNDRNVCVTGGEPLLQKEMNDLLNALLKEGKKIVLETNGSIDISSVPISGDLMISMDIKCPSSGMSDRMNMSNIAYMKPTDQLKFVISDNDDLEYAISLIDSYDADCNIILCPVGGLDLKDLAEKAVERRLNVRVLPQLHKIIWGGKRGV
jgi:7-carboxy-7-deazaguanine synthase